MGDNFRRAKTLSDLRGPLLPKTASTQSLTSVRSLKGSPRRSDSINSILARQEASSPLRRCYFWIQLVLVSCLAVMVGAGILMLTSPLSGTAQRSLKVTYTSEYRPNGDASTSPGEVLIPFAKASVAAPVQDALTFRSPALYTEERQKGSPEGLIRSLEQLPFRSQRIVEQCPQSTMVRVFVGIASRASLAGLPKRNNIRTSWMQDIATTYSEKVKAQFLLSQPSMDIEAVVEDLAMEVKAHGDLAIVPGIEDYFRLPEKTIAMMRYALSSACDYTHILKTDDDVYLRTQYLLDIIDRGLFDGAMHVQAKTNLDYMMVKRARRDGPGNQSPWMSKMFVGKVDRNVTGTFPGFEPVRDPANKWYLSEEAYPDSLGPHRIRWISGWGYLMSRDVVEVAMNNVMDGGRKPACVLTY